MHSLNMHICIDSRMYTTTISPTQNTICIIPYKIICKFFVSLSLDIRFTASSNILSNTFVSSSWSKVLKTLYISICFGLDLILHKFSSRIDQHAMYNKVNALDDPFQPSMLCKNFQPCPT